MPHRVPGSPAVTALNLPQPHRKRGRWETHASYLAWNAEGISRVGCPGNLQLLGLTGFFFCNGPRMTAWHFQPVCPFWSCTGSPVLDCDSQISVPNLQLSARPCCARCALPGPAARPGILPWFPAVFTRPFETPEGKAGGRAAWEEED